MPIQLPPHFTFPFFFYPVPRPASFFVPVQSHHLQCPLSLSALLVRWLDLCQTHHLLHSCAGETNRRRPHTILPSPASDRRGSSCSCTAPLCRLQSPYRHASTRPGGRRVKCQQPGRIDLYLHRHQLN
ncbi:hypothetical protein GGI43DRAFT_290203 [Trichoderma evansii]